MADGWRDRLLAPIYALAITFVLVLITGFTLNKPNNPAPPDLSSLVQFDIVQQGRTGPQEIQDLPVHVRLAEDMRQLLADVRLGRSGKFTLLVPDQDFEICLSVPPGWSVEGVPRDGRSADSCRRFPARTKDVVITLRRGS